MFELHVGELLCNFQCRVHETKRRCENQFVTIGGHLTNYPFAVRTFFHAFDESCFDLVSQFVLNGLTTNIMAIRPAMVTDRSYIYKADFILGIGATSQKTAGERRGADQGRNMFQCHYFLLCFHDVLVGFFYAAG